MRYKLAGQVFRNHFFYFYFRYTLHRCTKLFYYIFLCNVFIINYNIGLQYRKTGNDAEILQIAATDGKDEFSIHMNPCNVISPEASAVNKLTLQRGILFYDGKPITDAIATDVALKTFIEN